MLHLAIISIVCAVSAPSEGTSLTLLKRNDPNIICNFDGGEQSVARPPLPGTNNVDCNNFGCATEKVTNRTSSLFEKFINKQYSNSRSFCSNMENVISGKKSGSEINFTFRKRNLLWVGTSPETEVHSRSCRAVTCRPDSLCCPEKKKFLRLKKIKSQRVKRNTHKSQLDKVKLNDELDIDERIEKLVEQIALKNHQTEENSIEKLNEQTRGYSDQEKKGPVLTKVQRSFPFSDNIKRKFKLSKDYFNNKNNHVRSVPVNIVRGKDSNAEELTRISSYNIPRSLRKANRFRRSYLHGSEPLSRYGNKLGVQYYPRSAESENISLHKNEDKFNLRNRKNRRYQRSRSGIHRMRRENLPFAQKFTQTYEQGVGSREENTASNNCEDETCKEASVVRLNLQSFKSKLYDRKVHADGENINIQEVDEGMGGAKNIEVPDNPEQTLERPAIDLQQETLSTWNPILRNHPLFNDIGLDSNDKGSNKDTLSFSRYLQICHSLRNYLTHSNAVPLTQRRVIYQKKKRGINCQGGSMPHKCWRSAPLLCIPYIRKGQDELLKYLIRSMQQMLGKPFPQKIDIFEKTKFKPCPTNPPNHSCEDIMPQNDGCDNEPTSCPPQQQQQPCPCPPPPYPLTMPPSATTLKPFASTSKGHPVTPKPYPTMPTPTSSFTTPNLCPLTPTPYPSSLKPCPTNPMPSFTNPLPCPATPMPYPSNPLLCPSMGLPCPSTSFPFITTPMPYLTTPMPCPMTPLPCPATPMSFSNLPKSSPITPKPCPPPGSAKPCSPPPAPKCPPVCPPSYKPGMWPTTNPCTSPPSITFSDTYQVISSTEYFYVSSEERSATPAGTGTQYPTFTVPSNHPPVFQTATPSRGPSYSTPMHIHPPPQGVKLPTFSNPLRAMSPFTPAVAYRTLAPTINSCSWYISKSPVERSEYFSFKALPCKDVPNYTFMPCQNMKNQMEHQPAHYDQDQMTVDSTMLPYDLCSANMDTTTSGQPIDNFMIDPSLEMDVKNKDNPKTFQNMYTGFSQLNPGYYSQLKDFKRNKDHWRKASEFGNNGNYGSTFFNTNRYPYSSSEPFGHFQKMNLHIASPRFTSKSYRKGSGKNNIFMNNNYDYNEQYPTPKAGENISKFNKRQMAWRLKKDLSRKSKKGAKKRFSKRLKRSANWADYYNDYNYDSNYNDQELNGVPMNNLTPADSIEAQMSDASLSETDPPPLPNLFEDLAKALTECDANSARCSTTVGSTKPSNGSSYPMQFPNSTQTNGSNGTSSATTSNTTAALMPTTADLSSSANLTTETFNESTSIPTTSSMGPTPPSFNSKSLSSNSKHHGKLQDDESATEDKIPTPLKTAVIAKGMKKLVMKPSPKVYIKVFPDSLPNEEGNVDKTTTTTTKSTIEKAMPMQTSPKPDVRLQLLAVCEGYLEVVKLIKAQNQSLEEELDSDLARYCENIISQSFNFPSDTSQKLKKPETYALTTPKTNNSLTLQSNFYKSIKKLTNKQKIMSNAMDADRPVVKREFQEINKENGEIKEEKAGNKKVSLKFKNREGKNSEGGKTKIKHGNENLKRYRRKEETEEELLKKGMSDEQVELLQLLRKRKRALLSWLYNSKDQNKADNFHETEYFDDDEFISPNSELSESSGTIAPKGHQETTVTRENSTFFVNESIFPIYAKHYGYDGGGEVREVEVLWRSVNEKTHEKKILKNLSVLALLLTSPIPRGIKQLETRLVGNPGYENEDAAEIQAKSDKKYKTATVPGTTPPKKNSTESVIVTVTLQGEIHDNSSQENKTYIQKPDPSSIVGTPPNATTSSPNATHKMSHKLGAAKDLLQEYTIEFLNYAVYILPVMFTLLFLICCMCCLLQIITNKKKNKIRRKKKKKDISSEEDSEITEDSEPEVKKKRRENKSKKEPSNDPDDDNLSKKRSKLFWNILKRNSNKQNSEFNDENSQTEKKRSFLRFLKSRKDDVKGEDIPFTPLQERDELPKRYSDTDEKKHLDSEGTSGGRSGRRTGNGNNDSKVDEANERRELIALLEELKKIESENVEEKKEKKSVYVQYMTQEEENPAFRNPNFPQSYDQKRTLGIPMASTFCSKHFPFHESDIENYEMYEDVGELTELIPCTCNYVSRKKNYMRHADFQINREGRCQRFFKIFRDSGGSHSKHCAEMDFIGDVKDTSCQFNKNICVNTRESDLFGKTHTDEISLPDNMFQDISPFGFPTKKRTDILDEMENLKRHLNTKKYVRLKDNGVLCRL